MPLGAHRIHIPRVEIRLVWASFFVPFSGLFRAGTDPRAIKIRVLVLILRREGRPFEILPGQVLNGHLGWAPFRLRRPHPHLDVVRSHLRALLQSHRPRMQRIKHARQEPCVGTPSHTRHKKAQPRLYMSIQRQETQEKGQRYRVSRASSFPYNGLVKQLNGVVCPYPYFHFMAPVEIF